jgi:hypothetical protein
MIQIGDNWKCGYCGHAQVLALERMTRFSNELDVQGWNQGRAGVSVTSIVCANRECRAMSLIVQLLSEIVDLNRNKHLFPFKSWTLLPPSAAQPQPDYIPQAIRDDYYEACAIRDLSPKASATIIRRCLQGMIRDFCGISKRRLVDEIDELRERVHKGNAPPGVQPDNVDAIDIVRKIGNIGAHMEADIDVIVDVDPDEAQTLIELVETLFSDWYGARKARTQQMSKLKLIAEEKAKQKQQPPASAPLRPPETPPT